MVQKNLVYAFLITLIVSGTAIANDCNITRDSAFKQKSDWEIFCNDTLKGKLRFPPSELVEELYSAGTAKIVSAILPFGRSPEKDYTDINQPRSLVYWQNGKSGPHVQQSNEARVVFGYTPRLNQLEVISFNNNTGENEFRIVRNYTGQGRPTVEVMDKRLCMSCHQNNLPLFPVIPWSETQENPRIFDGLTESKKHNKLEPFASYLMEQQNFLKLGLNNIVDFDILIKSDYFQTMKLCSQYCKHKDKQTEAQCQKNLVLSALTKAAEANQSISNEESKKVLTKIWANFETQNPIYRITMDIDEREHPDRPFKSEKINSNSEDPLTKRSASISLAPISLLNINYGQSCFRFSNEDIRTIGSNFATNIRAFAESKSLTDLVQHWIPNEEILVKAFIDPKLRIEAPRIAVNASEQMTVVNKDLQKNEKPQDLFYMSCIGCHYAKEAVGGLVPVGEREKIKAYVGAAGRTATELIHNSITGKGRSMPPVDSPFYQPTEKQKQIMLDWLNN